MSINKKKSSSSSSSSSDDGKPKTYYQSTIPGQHIIQQQIVQPQQHVAYQSGIVQSGIMQSGMVQTSQMQTLNQLPVGITEEQIRRSLVGVSLETVKGEVRSEYIPVTRMEVEYKEEVQYEQIPRQVKVTDYYQVEYQQERIPSVLQHTITEYVPQQKIIPQVNYKAIEKTYTRPEIMAGDVRVEQGAAEIISTQIIQTESQAHTVAYPQIATSGVTYTQGPQVAQYSTVMQGKRKSSSIKYNKTQMIQPQMQMAMSPSRIQMAQPARQMPIQTMPMQTTMQTMPMQTMPMQTMPMQTMPMQTIPTASIKYAAQPMQTFGSPMIQQSNFLPQQAAPMFMNGPQPGMPMNNFQGVRLADSHILMK